MRGKDHLRHSDLRLQSAIVFKKAVVVFQSFHNQATVSRIGN